MTKVTRLDYCQFLLVSQTNYTLTYFAEHSPGFSHDAVKRYLEQDKLTARMVWEQVQADIVPSEKGCIAFDDTVLDHNSAAKIELGVATLRFRKTGADLNVAEIMRKTVLYSPDRV